MSGECDICGECEFECWCKIPHPSMIVTWINVRERLPTDEEVRRSQGWFFVHFVVKGDKQNTYRSMRPFTKGAFGFPHDECDEKCSHCEENILHWMPLPGPPEVIYELD